MKKVIIYQILNRLKNEPKLMKKVKTFLIFGSIFFVILSGLIIWAGVSAVQYMASSTKQVIQSPVAQDHVENIKTELAELPKFQLASCWFKTQSLMTLQIWLEKPLQENIQNLKSACFKSTSKSSAETPPPEAEYF